ncbi:MAG: hypothetical protein WC464_04540 [Bdellovibrionales bacterium]
MVEKNLAGRLFEKLAFVDTVRRRRRRVVEKVDRLFGSTVAYGPFRGMKLSKHPRWSYADRASIMLGLYEKEVLESLQKVPPSYKTFIDLGAADGYYAVGVLINNMFERSYAFEISEEGQSVIKQTAALNGVSDRIAVGGKADKDFFKHLPADELGRTVVLSDIEGGEFDLFDEAVFGVLKDAIFIIELHDWFFEDGPARLQKLKDAAKKTHEISAFTTGSRDLSQFKELATFHDIDRWLICVEGRKRLMTWLRLDPLKA